MAELLTPVDTLNLLTENGYRFYGSCNCHGSYWEKFRKRGGYTIKIAPKKDLYNVPGLKLGGAISELAVTIQTLA